MKEIFIHNHLCFGLGFKAGLVERMVKRGKSWPGIGFCICDILKHSITAAHFSFGHLHHHVIEALRLFRANKNLKMVH